MAQAIIHIQCADDIQEILLAELSLLGYEGFQQHENQLDAYIEEEQLDKNALENLLKRYGLESSALSQSKLEDKNWNALWESNFESINVDALNVMCKN